MKKFFLCLIIFYCQQSFAAHYIPHRQLENLAKEFLLKQTYLDADETLNVSLGEAGHGLKLPQCKGNLSVSFPENTNRDNVSTLELACTGTKGWHSFLPVSVSIISPVLVAKKTIYPKETITEDQVKYAKLNRKRLFLGYYKDITKVIGQVSTRLIPAGTVLNKRNLSNPLMVYRNHHVTIIAQKGAIMIKAEGLARSDGALNDMIKVYNPSSKRTIDAVVTGSNQVSVV